MNNDALDATIPVLTEIITQQQNFVGTSSPPSFVKPTETQTADPADLPPSAVLSASQWEALERKISERSLRQLQARIDFVLEHRLRDGLGDAFQLAVEGMVAEIKRGLHQTLEDVITRAVAQEIARLQTADKQE